MGSLTTWTPVKNVGLNLTVSTSYDVCDAQEASPDPQQPPTVVTVQDMIPFPLPYSAPPALYMYSVFDFPAPELPTPPETTRKRTSDAVDSDSKRMKTEVEGTDSDCWLDVEIYPSEDSFTENMQMVEVPEEVNQPEDPIDLVEHLVSNQEPSTSSEVPARRKSKLLEGIPTKIPASFTRKPRAPRVQPVRAQPRNRYGKINVHRDSRLWFAKSSIVCVSRRNGVAEAARRVLKYIEDEVKESNCNAYMVPLEETAPMTWDFRGLSERLDEMVLADPIELDDVSASTHDYPDKISFTGAPLLDPMTTSSHEVLEAAKRRRNTNENHVYQKFDKTKNKYFFDDCNQIVVSKELEFFERFRGEEPAPAPGYLPVPIYQVDSLEQMPRVLEVLSTTSMSVVRGLGDVIGLNPDDFLIETLAKVKHDYDLICLRQIPQKATTNYWCIPWKGKKGAMPCGWACYEAHHTKKLGDFSGYYEKIQELVREAISQIETNPEDVDKITEELANKMKDSSMPLDGITGIAKDATMSAFGTNMDLTDAKTWPRQAANVTRFPDAFRPDGCGTLLNYAGEMIAGLNKPQMYLKLPGARTIGHLENNCLASLNYNIGPGDCIWYGIPMEYAAQVQKIVAKRMKSQKMLIEGFWGCEAEIIAAGIPLQKFIQKPGDLVYVGIGTYHWVQSNGFTTNLSWNLATPTYIQLAVAAACHDYYLANKYPSLMPIEVIAWNMVMQRAEMDEKMKQLVKSILMRSLANCQFEIDYFSKKPKIFTPKDAKNSDVNMASVERCQECRQVLFNNVPVVLIKEHFPPKKGKPAKYIENDGTGTTVVPLVFCFGCCAKMRFRHVTVYQRYSLDTLAALFDGFHVSRDVPPAPDVPSTSNAFDDPYDSEDDDDYDPNAPSTSTAHLHRRKRYH
ncbi:hypothetical protein GCK72_016250 [Caenorhabditis remanei]|uniref:JmjC domain-containing protein n=1 Tax=Caenorhabditis remanei TaxID=31234 RepID=A0A6A5GZF3_CAERE|nr:hypothetical protein GCK72_016250 [Caenorhabditis remanei]KAF1759783.1 hypothetical protein GCK72_016250 [Caenorhabditis remanei]